jgi:hypothetical protein
MGEMKDAHSVLVWRSKRKKSLGRYKLRYDDNIKMHLKEIGFAGRGWIDLAQNRDKWRALVNAVMNHWVHCCIQFLQ